MILMAKPKYLVINLPHYCCFPCEPHMDCSGLGSKLAINGESGDWAVAQPNCVDNLVPAFICGYEAEIFFMWSRGHFFTRHWWDKYFIGETCKTRKNLKEQLTAPCCSVGSIDWLWHRACHERDLKDAGVLVFHLLLS